MRTIKLAESTLEVVKEWAYNNLKEAYNEMNEDAYEEAYGVCIDFNVDVSEFDDFDLLLTNAKSRAKAEADAEVWREIQAGL